MTIADLKISRQRTLNSQRVAVLNGPRDISMAYADIPEPGPGEVRVKIKWVGICGSDIEAYRGTRKAEFISTPARLGHEVAGIIDKIGDGVVGLDVGAQVACRYVWGAFAEYIVCKPFNVKVLPKGFPLIECSLIEVLPGVIHAAELSEINPSKTVLATGQGVSGLVMTQVLKLYSPKALVVTDTRQRNLDLARQYGATHAYKIGDAEDASMPSLREDFPDGFDVVIPCLLEGDGMVDAIDCAAFCGRIVMYGCIGVCNKPIDFFTVHRKRLNIYSTEPRRDIDMRRFFQEGVQLVLDGLVNTAQMITDIVPLSEIDRAFKIRDDKSNSSIHVMVDCEK
jgi:threonine dehydrogenase-like Zn-dependent dehydrogenase